MSFLFHNAMEQMAGAFVSNRDLGNCLNRSDGGMKKENAWVYDLKTSQIFRIYLLVAWPPR
jgi:hypothetical protein